MISLVLEPDGAAAIRLEREYAGAWEYIESADGDRIRLFDLGDGVPEIGFEVELDGADDEAILALRTTEVDDRWPARLEPADVPAEGAGEPTGESTDEIAGRWLTDAPWPHPDGYDVWSALTFGGGEGALSIVDAAGYEAPWRSGPAAIWARPSDGLRFWTIAPYDSEEGGPDWWIFGGEIEAGVLYTFIDIDPAEGAERYAAYALSSQP